MYSPVAPHRVQDVGICHWEGLVFPRSVALDNTDLSNHLDNDELPWKSLKVRLTRTSIPWYIFDDALCCGS